MSRRVFVSVSGGVVDEVIVPKETDGTWTVIDWDNIESDPAPFRSTLRLYVRTLALSDRVPENGGAGGRSKQRPSHSCTMECDGRT